MCEKKRVLFYFPNKSHKILGLYHVFGINGSLITWINNFESKKVSFNLFWLLNLLFSYKMTRTHFTREISYKCVFNHHMVEFWMIWLLIEHNYFMKKNVKCILLYLSLWISQETSQFCQKYWNLASLSSMSQLVRSGNWWPGWKIW